MERGRASGHADEIAAGDRFALGRNWRDFLDRLTEARILGTMGFLRNLLGEDGLRGKRFVDAPSAEDGAVD